MKRTIAIVALLSFAAGPAPAQAFELENGPGSEPQSKERMGVTGNLPGPETFGRDAVWMNPHRRPALEPIGIPTILPPEIVEEPRAISKGTALALVGIGLIILAVMIANTDDLIDLDLGWNDSL